MPDPSDSGLTTVFFTAFGIVAVLVVATFVAIVVLAVYRRRRLRQQGIDPLTLQTDLTARALRSGMLAPARSKSERLRELDGLLASGTISESEHGAARSRVLAE